MDFLRHSYLVYVGIMGLGAVVWFVLTLVRQHRMHDLAATLGADYRPRGLFRVGAVEGTWKGHSFVIGTDGAITSIFMRVRI